MHVIVYFNYFEAFSGIGDRIILLSTVARGLPGAANTNGIFYIIVFHSKL